MIDQLNIAGKNKVEVVMDRTMTDRMDKWLAEIDTAIRSQKEKDNTFTVCILEEAKRIIQHYHDLDKAGKLVELPCLPNEMVWQGHDKYSLHEVMYASKAGIVSDIEDGYIIGRTKEEAEAKLAEKGGVSDEID